MIQMMRPLFSRCLSTAGLFLVTGTAVASISVEFQFGAFDAPAGSLGVIVADTGGNGFQPPASIAGVSLDVGSVLGVDDVIIAVFQSTGSPDFGARRGFATHVSQIDYEAMGLEEGQSLQLYVFPERAVGDPVRTGEPHLAYRTEDPAEISPESSMGFILPEDEGAYLLSLLEPGLGGFADLSMVDIAPAPLTGRSGEIDGLLGPTERHTFYFNVADSSFLSVSGEGDPGIRVELYHRDGQLVASSDGKIPYFLEELLQPGFHTLVIYRNPTAAGNAAYGIRFDPDYVRFVRPDIAVGASPFALIGGGTTFAPGPSVALTSRKARTVTGYATVANLGGRPEKLAVSAGKGSRFIRARYFGTNGNITAGLVSGSHRTALLDEGSAADRVRAAFTPDKKIVRKRSGGKTVIARKSLSSLVSARSTSDPGLYDGGWLRVRTR